MLFSLVVAISMEMWGPKGFDPWEIFLASVLLTTVGWVTVTLLTRPENEDVLESFKTSIRAAGDDGTAFRKEIRRGILLAVTMAIATYSVLFGTGAILFGNIYQVGNWIFLAMLSGTASVLIMRQSPTPTVVQLPGS